MTRVLGDWSTGVLSDWMLECCIGLLLGCGSTSSNFRLAYRTRTVCLAALRIYVQVFSYDALLLKFKYGRFRVLSFHLSFFLLHVHI